jgi:hypothetical protein
MKTISKTKAFVLIDIPMYVSMVVMLIACFGVFPYAFVFWGTIQAFEAFLSIMVGTFGLWKIYAYCLKRRFKDYEISP